MIARAMRVFRQILVLTLLSVLPFQLGLGAALAVCPQAGHHGDVAKFVSPELGMAPDAKVGLPHADHVRAAGEAVAQPVADGSAPHDYASGRCGSCCASETAVSTHALLPTVRDIRLVTFPVADETHPSGLADRLFRPPRSTTL